MYASWEGLSIECFEKSRRGVPLLPLQTLVDFELLYCGRQAPRLSIPGTTSPEESWPIGQDLVASEGDDKVIVDRAEPSIFHDELATAVHMYSRDESYSSAPRPQSMFEVPCDRRPFSTATILMGDATKDERAPGGMSDEARTAMLDVVAHTPSNAVDDRSPSPGNSDRLSPSTKPGVPLTKVATEVQAARQLTSKTMTTIQHVESMSTTSEGKGDARTSTNGQAGTSLYPGLNSGSSKTLLDYYSARMAERSQPSRLQHSPPRVTMSFFPSLDRDANQSLTPTPTSSSVAGYGPLTVADRSSRLQPRHTPRRMQSAAGGLRATTPADSGYRRQPNVTATSEQTENEPATSTKTTKTDATSPSTSPAVTTKAAATTEQTTPGGNRPVMKPADRKLSEPLPVASSTTNVTPVGGGSSSETATGSSGRRAPNAYSGAATDVFLSSILSHLVPVPQTVEKDWGHFTLVKPANSGQVNVDSKTTVAKNVKR